MKKKVACVRSKVIMAMFVKEASQKKRKSAINVYGHSLFECLFETLHLNQPNCTDDTEKILPLAYPQMPNLSAGTYFACGDYGFL